MKFLRLAAIAVLLSISANSVAQKRSQTFTFKGATYKINGEVLPNATIYIVDLKRGTVSDSTGHFVLSAIPQGNYLVEIDYTGYKSIIENIRFDKNIEKDFHLEVAVTEEKEIVITGVSRATSIKRNPVPIVSLSKKSMEQTLSTNLIDAIAAVPGVSAVSTGPNVSKPFIRGLGYNRVLVLFDGIRQEGQQWGDEHGIELDENMVEKVEVIKGPASLMYGSDAIAGVINFLPAPALPKGQTRGNVSLNYHTNNNLLEGAAAIQQHISNLSWQLLGSYKMAADYQNKIDGRVYNTGFRQASLFGAATLHGRRGYSRFGLSLFNDVQEIPGGKRDSTTRKFEKLIDGDEYEIVSPHELRSYKISGDYQQVQHFRMYNKSSFSLGNGRAITQLGFQKSIRKEFETGDNDAALFLNLNTVTYDAKYLFPEFSDLGLTAGMNGMYQHNLADRGHEFLIPSYRQFDAGPFVYGKYSKKKLEIAGGVRFDWRYLNTVSLYTKEKEGETIPVYGKDTAGATRLFSSAHHVFSGLSGSLGFSYQFNKQWSFKANVARGFRAPNISEISANGIHSGSQFYQLGNRDFDPEFSFQQDIGISFANEHVTLNASLFNNRIQHYIYNRKLVNDLGQDSIIVPGFPTFQYTSSRADLWGGEFLLDFHPHPLDWLHIENGFSFVNARNLGNRNEKIADEEKYLPFIPPFQWRTELRANFKEWRRLQDIFIKLEWHAFAAQNRVFTMNGTETPTPGYQLINGGIGAGLKGRSGKTLFTLSLLAQNIFNVAYQSNMSRLKYFEDYPNDPRGHSGIYNMGRNVSIKISVPLGSTLK